MEQWERLDGEPEVAYARFLLYRNLGPARTLEAAYSISCRAKAKDSTKRHIPGSWGEECARYSWRERATAWDIAQLETIVPGSVATIYTAIGEFAKVTLDQLQSGKVRPRNWAQVMAALNVLANFVTPETADAARARLVGKTAGDAPSDIGASAGGDTD